LPRILRLPPEIELIAYLCIGYPVELSSTPMLEKVGWKKRETLAPLLFADTWGEPYTCNHADPNPAAGEIQPASIESIRAAARQKNRRQDKTAGFAGKARRVGRAPGNNHRHA